LPTTVRSWRVPRDADKVSRSRRRDDCTATRTVRLAGGAGIVVMRFLVCDDSDRGEVKASDGLAHDNGRFAVT
jgi:hypothetical protein